MNMTPSPSDGGGCEAFTSLTTSIMSGAIAGGAATISGAAAASATTGVASSAIRLNPPTACWCRDRRPRGSRGR